MIANFASGQRISTPATISGGTVEYFLPHPLGGVVVNAVDNTLAVATTAPLIAPWLLDAARFASDDIPAFGADDAISRALMALSQGPIVAERLRIAHSRLLRQQQPSRWRDAIAWVNGNSPGDAKFVPPPSTAIEMLIDDLCLFLARPDVPLWVRQAFAYYQFLHIHPFADGNGRMSRLLVVALGASLPAHRARSLIVAIALCVHRKAFIRHFDKMQTGSSEAYFSRWRALDAWSADYTSEVAATESGLLSTLTDLVGARHARCLFHAFASDTSLTAHAMAVVLKSSSKNASRHIQRLRDSSWIDGPDDRIVAIPIRAAQQGIVTVIAEETAAILT